MRIFLTSIVLCFCASSMLVGQGLKKIDHYEKHGVVWSAGLFKSWLKDQNVAFNKIGDKVEPIFSESYKQGFTVQSHYMYKPVRWMGVGVHAGLGLDVNSYIASPLVLFGASISFGNDHQFLIDFGLSDGKRRVVPMGLREELERRNYNEIPELEVQTELNSGFYLAISYNIF